MGGARQFEGATLQETLRAASSSLGVPEARLHYEILEVGRRGIFGLGVRNVRIRVELPEAELQREAAAEAVPRGTSSPDRSRQQRPRPPRTTPRERSPVVERVEGAVQQMFGLMQLQVRVRGLGREGGVRLELDGADRRLLLQKDAELLLALQFLLNRMARRSWPGAGRIQLSCDGYRTRRDQEVVELAREAAQQVVSTGRTKRLPPMNPYERRLVHITVREFGELATRSEGDGFLKKIRVSRK